MNTPTPATTHYLIGGKVYETLTSPQYVATVPSTQLTELSSPFFVWTGHKMPVVMVHSCLAFFRDCYQRYKGEAMVRLAYHPEQGWKAVPMPQEGRAGMAVTDRADEKVLQQLSKDGYSLFGSAHSHCQATAFASGTDNADEEKSPGLHFTLGKIDSSPVDIHVRATLRKVKFEVKLSDWFWDPRVDALSRAGLPSPVVEDCLRYFLLNPEKDITFPEEWKEVILESRGYSSTSWSTRTPWNESPASTSFPVHSKWPPPLHPPIPDPEPQSLEAVRQVEESRLTRSLRRNMLLNKLDLSPKEENYLFVAIENFLWDPAFCSGNVSSVTQDDVYERFSEAATYLTGKLTETELDVRTEELERLEAYEVLLTKASSVMDLTYDFDSLLDVIITSVSDCTSLSAST